MKKPLLLAGLIVIAMSSFSQQAPISADFPFESNYQKVLDSKMHFVDEGDPNSAHTFLLLHGNPTSSYLWRNIIPHLTPKGRVVVPDLIGMGKSGKPAIDYTFEDHIQYMDAFIDGLGLDNIILVVQDWGSGLGFHYAHRYQNRVAGIVFFEAITRPIEWKEANLIERFIFKRFRHPEKGHKLIVEKNFFVEKFIPMMAGRKLTQEEMDQYRAPYLEKEDRKPVRVWPTQIPIGGEPEFSTKVIQAYADYLPTSSVPKMMFHVKPGMIIKKKEADKIKSSWNNLETIFLGKGKHYIQEQYPHQIGDGIAAWYAKTY
ncbi:MAG: haloalkane dehalogenase [Cytophagales bacterium]|nr:haloalkane dehalogenase [Cytophagales bacterium]